MKIDYKQSDEFFEDYPEDELLPKILEMKGFNHPDVLKAFRSIPRTLFYESQYKETTNLGISGFPIEIGKTLTEPYLIATVLTALKTTGPTDKVLEIGTGYGYQTALLSQLAKYVFSIERVPEIFEYAKEMLRKLNIQNVELFCADGLNGLISKAPFDAVIVKAAAQDIAEPLKYQLADQGRLIAIAGGPTVYELTVIKRENSHFTTIRSESIAIPLMPGIGGSRN